MAKSEGAGRRGEGKPLTLQGSSQDLLFVDLLVERAPSGNWPALVYQERI